MKTIILFTFFLLTACSSHKSYFLVIDPATKECNGYITEKQNLTGVNDKEIFEIKNNEDLEKYTKECKN